ncbi:MAG: hypothetical protein Kow00114_27580 [Kiloniellaceae bacterium]
MSPDGCLAMLTVYTLEDGEFKSQDGKAVPDWPAVLAELHAYWQRCCRGRPYPARADIDPVDIPALLEHLLLADVLHDPLDFRYRLVGGHIVEHAGRNVQGHTVRGLMADGGAQEQALQEKAMLAGRAVAETRAPVFIDLSYRSVTSDNRKHLHGLLLPLGLPGEGPNMVLGGLSFLE